MVPVIKLWICRFLEITALLTKLVRILYINVFYSHRTLKSISSLTIYLSIYLQSIKLKQRFFVFIFVRRLFLKNVCLSLHLSVCMFLSIHLSVCMHICLSICLLGLLVYLSFLNILYMRGIDFFWLITVNKSTLQIKTR